VTKLAQPQTTALNARFRRQGDQIGQIFALLTHFDQFLKRRSPNFWATIFRGKGGALNSRANVMGS
jgi:hypothetical protein